MNNTLTSLGKLGKVNSKTNSKVNTKVKAKAIPFWQIKMNRSLAIKLSAFLIIIGLIGLGAWRVSATVSGKILPKVKIAGLKVGGKTPAEAETIVKNYVSELSTKGPEITYDNQTISPKLNEMGVAFDIDKVVNEAYSVGRSGSVKNRVFENAKMVVDNYNISLDPKIDETKLDAYLSQIAKVVEVAPENASMSVQNGSVNVTPEKNGRGLDKDKLKKDLTDLINQNQTTGKITLVTSELIPDILVSGTVDAKSQAEKYMASAPITATYNDRSFTADKSEVGSWVTFTNSGDKIVASISDSKIAGWTGSVASQVEVQKVDREIMDGTGQVLNEGQDGIGVDTGRLTNGVKSRVIATAVGAPIAIATFPIPKGQIVTNPNAQPGRYAGRYVDINLSQQTLYAFEGTKLVNQFLVSTGRTGPTPTGEFNVYSKSRVTRMDGPGYDLPGVEWVSWFSGDYSIHGTYWHNNFGHPMSHGCVNASNGDAEWLYGWDEVGTPVYIHW